MINLCSKQSMNLSVINIIHNELKELHVDFKQFDQMVHRIFNRKKLYNQFRILVNDPRIVFNQSINVTYIHLYLSTYLSTYTYQ